MSQTGKRFSKIACNSMAIAIGSSSRTRRIRPSPGKASKPSWPMRNKPLCSERTFAILGGCKHIKPTIYTDKELAFVREEDAPGITSYREQARQLFEGPKCASFPTKRLSPSSTALASCFVCC